MSETSEKELLEFYRQTVLQHSRDPHNFERLASADLEATGHNPLCGDKVTVYVDMERDSLARVTFEGSGCAISLASASIMTDTLAGLGRDAARRCAQAVMSHFDPEPDGLKNGVPKSMAAFEGVRRYPSRIKCATLAWKTFAAALDEQRQPVSTE